MKMAVSLAVAALAAATAPLGACTNQQGSQPTTSSGAPSGAERMSTQLKSADGTAVANATFDFASGYATVTVEAGANQVLTPGFHGLQVHSVGKCEAGSVGPAGGSAGDYYSAGDVYQAPNHTGYPASGDLTALEVRPDGSAKLVTTTSAFTASDLRNSSGTALIIHQDPGSLGTSSTDAGKRVACGVIAAAAATTTSSTTTTSISTITTTVAVPPPSTSTSTVTVTGTPTGTSTPITTVTTSLPPGS